MGRRGGAPPATSRRDALLQSPTSYHHYPILRIMGRRPHGNSKVQRDPTRNRPSLSSLRAIIRQESWIEPPQAEKNQKFRARATAVHAIPAAPRLRNPPPPVRRARASSQTSYLGPAFEDPGWGASPPRAWSEEEGCTFSSMELLPPVDQTRGNVPAFDGTSSSGPAAQRGPVRRLISLRSVGRNAPSFTREFLGRRMGPAPRRNSPQRSRRKVLLSVGSPRTSDGTETPQPLDGTLPTFGGMKLLCGRPKHGR